MYTIRYQIFLFLYINFIHYGAILRIPPLETVHQGEKLIRLGYKFWCLNKLDGYCVRLKIHEGREDRDPSMTVGSSVTKKRAQNFVPENNEIFLSFNSLLLLEETKTNHIHITGTICSDRLEKVPLRDLKKEPRGLVHGLKERIVALVYLGDTIIVKWPP